MSSSGHSVNQTYVYGPVTSRRYGTTIGINLLPQNNKICNFDCVYCQLGENREFKKVSPQDFPTEKQILIELRAILDALKNQHIDHIVISGNGEPTMHPQFAQIIATIRDEALKIKIPVVCLTNGSKILDHKVAAALQSLDECALKFDFNANEINRPMQSLSPASLADATRNFSNLTLQCCLALINNQQLDQTQLTAWMDDIGKFNAKRIDFYSLSRKPAVSTVYPVSKADWAIIKKTAREVLPHRPLHIFEN